VTSLSTPPCHDRVHGRSVNTGDWCEAMDRSVLLFTHNIFNASFVDDDCNDLVMTLRCRPCQRFPSRGNRVSSLASRHISRCVLIFSMSSGACSQQMFPFYQFCSMRRSENATVRRVRGRLCTVTSTLFSCEHLR